MVKFCSSLVSSNGIMIRQPGTNIKCGGEGQTDSRLTNVSIVRIKKGGKRFEVG